MNLPASAPEFLDVFRGLYGAVVLSLVAIFGSRYDRGACVLLITTRCVPFLPANLSRIVSLNWLLIFNLSLTLPLTLTLTTLHLHRYNERGADTRPAVLPTIHTYCFSTCVEDYEGDAKRMCEAVLGHPITEHCSVHLVRCAFFDEKLHSRMPLDPTPARLKLLHACYQW